MSRSKELFRPRVEGRVGMYVCGVTAYDLSHIGHARVYVTFDVLYRYLQHLKYEVLYVRNFTDVDDKIIARANELGEDPLSLSSRFCDEFHADMAYLHCLPPSVEPRVSNHMDQIIDMIKQIFDNGCAYKIDGDVYFSVDKFSAYGRLSGRKLEDNRAGERVALDSRKKNPADFALWKSAKPGEPYWESPWGPGRPGWHIECSAMSAAYLGYSFDIHGGGMDLVFPHHENEIAQSCAACRSSSISYWIHNGFVNVDSEKMSKSLGNFFTIRQVIDLYHPLALRLFLIGTHYRSPINYSNAQLETASDRLFYIFQALHDCEEILRQNSEINLEDFPPKDTLDCITRFRSEFEYSMTDDLHTPVALAALSEPLKIINDLLHTRKGRKQQKRIESISAIEKEIKNSLTILGLMPSSYHELLLQLREKALKRAGLTEEQVLEKIDERSSARKNKQYERSDEIRRELAAVGIALMDGPEGTTWRPGIPLDIQEKLASVSQ
ncbi:uncharacterized protein A4U43_C05F33050 [Asparagus officinalis]|uniref:cysteine--tRNA ligase n=1 Tax=Asparagus officinalis TaxID=4686 RepID=A0A5P1EY38_ASPOF|nr:cysteine--tRNA ligase, chloroplastic/mitochondrial isoform X3 [Asparagus officinalis]ONK70373.1 uncharacterized protein A4U43_C05F33050 [Asparagus officinalis]